MTRTHPPTGKATPTLRYLPQSAQDPLNPLAEKVGMAVAQEVCKYEIKARRTKAGKSRNAAADTPNKVDLKARFSILVAAVLNQYLSSQTAEGKALRMALIAKLANEEAGVLAATAVPVKARPGADALLTTAEAAARLEVSRPYVSMLCDAGKLGEVAMTEGGHRRVRASAVDAYLAARIKQLEGTPSPRESGVEGGLYEYEDGHFRNVVREAAKTPVMTSAKPPRKPAKKSKSKA